MIHDRRSTLSSYVSDLLSKGRTVFTAEEAEGSSASGMVRFWMPLSGCNAASPS